ncbi:phosphoribosylanthranilate isomerase [Sediminibacillus massiliensis]|uniref:phosphoribosylanthranilate isomerase n=1 Tax=Sediminibacillus massiliensis TaxID=1926277 RepID=UPI0009887B7D|nr:phosphoribosylanthranilate isomerase [Sediminibacillus massiliensis]
MIVKICGIKNKQAAADAVQAGADFLGFVFASSKRRVTKEQAKEIAETLPRRVKKIGVFVNESPEVINDIAESVGLDYAQLHGDESPEEMEEIKVPVIKAFQINSKEDFEQIASYPCEYYLLDSPAGKYRGGNGEAFDWSLAEYMPEVNGKIFLAGGLKPGNVQQAITEVKPAGVDVSSGVETNGEKDRDKIDAFIRAAKRIEEENRK